MPPGQYEEKYQASREPIKPDIPDAEMRLQQFDDQVEAGEQRSCCKHQKYGQGPLFGVKIRTAQTKPIHVDHPQVPWLLVIRNPAYYVLRPVASAI